jgi:hypothetical protein
MVSRHHAICIRLGRLVDRCKLRDGQFAPETFLRIDQHDVKCLEEAIRLVTEHEAMKVDAEHRRERWASKK